jgi:predicted TIM-barrel fold metal-dependent hydrolase
LKELSLSLRKILKEFLVIDTHTHFGPFPGLFIPSLDDDNIIKVLRENGVNKAIFSHHNTLLNKRPDCSELISVLNNNKGFLFGLLGYNPNFPEESLRIINDNIDMDNILGIKMHPSMHCCYPVDNKYTDFWKIADEKKLIVLTHSWNPNVPNKAQRFSDPLLFEYILEKYRNIKLILGHAGGRGDTIYKIPDLMNKYKNLYVDFSGDVFKPGVVEYYCKNTDPERLLFGSDMPWVDARFSLSNIVFSDISKKNKKGILGLNAKKLYKIN